MARHCARIVVSGERRKRMDGVDRRGFGCGKDGRNLPLAGESPSRRFGGSSWMRGCKGGEVSVSGFLLTMNAREKGYPTWLGFSSREIRGALTLRSFSVFQLY